jgi:L-iditol 2-dehydrogenase
MKAALLYGPGEIRIENAPDPVPGPGEALVRIRAVGVCASDLHFFRHGEIGGWGFDSPALLGHECAGEVVALGPGGLRDADSTEDHRRFVPGDRVAVEPTRPCGACDLCRTGHYNICRSLRFAGQPPDPGAFAEYVAAPLNRLFPLSPALSFTEGAMVEPVAVAVHAVKLAGVKPGHTVAILGAGAIGLSILQTARAVGAARVMVSEPIASRRRLAEQLGADLVVDPTGGRLEAAARAWSSNGAHAAFEASGDWGAPAEAARLVGNAGVLCLVGIPDQDTLCLPASVVRRREMTIRTVRRYCDDFDDALALIASGSLNAAAYATHHFPLEETAGAFRMAVDHPADVVRAIVDLPPDSGAGSPEH